MGGRVRSMRYKISRTRPLAAKSSCERVTLSRTSHARSVRDANRSAPGFDVTPEDRVGSINRRPIVQRNGSGTIVRP